MRRARLPRVGALIVLAGWAGSNGCTHNHYYGNAVPVCASPADATTIHYGDVCEVPPTQVDGGAIVAQGPGRTTVLGGSPRPSRVLVSEPLTRGGGRWTDGWRRADPAGMATTKVEGALDDDTLTR